MSARDLHGPEPSTANNPVILHVIESFGAGSAGAMQEFVDATPEFTHHLLRAVRDGEYVESDTSSGFSQILAMPLGSLARLRAVRAAVKQLQPDVVHAHSSFAGLYVRVALRSGRRRRTVYSPHCFAFERLDLGLPARLLVVAVETVLALNTDLVAACSIREQRLARRLPTRRQPVYVPNTPRAIEADPRVPEPTTSTAVASIGRLGPQKDPERFAAVVRRLRRDAPAVRAVWIGDGDARLRAVLEGAGIHVTGWVSSAEVSRALAAADVYVHTAAWEGFPLAVLEAVTMGRPVVARRIGAFEGMPNEWLFDDDEQAARAVSAAHADPDRNRAAWRAALRDNTADRQRAALMSVYRSPALDRRTASATRVWR